jgi:surfeit locus 1 family protein
MRIMFNPLPWLSLAAAGALVVLILLGNWQWSRFEQKRAAPPPQQVELQAQLDLPRAVYVHAILDGVAGWRVFAPLQSHEGAMADVGFVPGLEPPARAPAELAADAPSLRGAWVTPRKPGPFAPAPDLVKRAFYGIDLAAMARAAGLAQTPQRYLAAAYGQGPNPFLRTGTAPERHLGYALTWWGLAAGLVAVYLGLHVTQRRLVVQ